MEKLVSSSSAAREENGRIQPEASDPDAFSEEDVLWILVGWWIGGSVDRWIFIILADGGCDGGWRWRPLNERGRNN